MRLKEGSKHYDGGDFQLGLWPGNDWLAGDVCSRVDLADGEISHGKNDLRIMMHPDLAFALLRMVLLASALILGIKGVKKALDWWSKIQSGR